MILNCHQLHINLYTRQDDIKDSFEEVANEVNFISPAVDEDMGDMARFLMSYINQVECLLHMIHASRQGLWELHLWAIEKQVRYYFAHDLYKYARLAPVYLAQIQMRKNTDHETWKALKCGVFMVTKSSIPFTNLFVDQTLEQLIIDLKVASGITENYAE